MSQPSLPIIYPYKPKKLIMIMCIVFFGLAAGILGNVALTNDRGLTLVLMRHVVEFSFEPFEATLFYWTLTVCSVVFSLLGILGLYRACTSKAQIVLTNEGISVPGSIFKPHTQTIPIKDILSLELVEVSRVRTLKIIHPGGKALVNDSMLPKKIMLDDIMNTLMSRIKSDQ